MSELDYQLKRNEILEKFAFGASEKYRNDAVFHTIVESLIRGADPYTLIEQLIDGRAASLKIMKEIVETMPPKHSPDVEMASFAVYYSDNRDKASVFELLKVFKSRINT